MNNVGETVSEVTTSVTKTTETKNDKVKLSVKGLKKDVADGLTRDQISAKYNLNLNQVRLAFKQAGIKMRAKTQPKFELINDDGE